MRRNTLVWNFVGGREFREDVGIQTTIDKLVNIRASEKEVEEAIRFQRDAQLLYRHAAKSRARHIFGKKKILGGVGAVVGGAVGLGAYLGGIAEPEIIGLALPVAGVGFKLGRYIPTDQQRVLEEIMRQCHNAVIPQATKDDIDENSYRCISTGLGSLTLVKGSKIDLGYRIEIQETRGVPRTILFTKFLEGSSREVISTVNCNNNGVDVDAHIPRELQGLITNEDREYFTGKVEGLSFY